MKSKSELRTEMAKLRDVMPEGERKGKSRLIWKRLLSLPEFTSAKTIAFYLSKGSEADTPETIEESLKLGKKIMVPITDSEIELVEFTSFEDLAPAKYGILEPKTKKILKGEPDIVIVPGLAFDPDFHRLGYGKGYYDRLLKKIKSIRIGVCFDIQIMEKIPRDGHDQRLDIIITEKRIMRVETK